MKLVPVAALCLLIVTPAFSGNAQFISPGPRDKCPVCGMFVAKYPDWTAQICFRDGACEVFDGPKDMFKYYLALKKYAPSRKQTDIAALYVYDYYGLRPVDGTRAFYVIGSDAYGPMGKELVPFEKEESAAEFLSDHKGAKILRFNQVTLEIMKGLD